MATAAQLDDWRRHQFALDVHSIVVGIGLYAIRFPKPPRVEFIKGALLGQPGLYCPDGGTRPIREPDLGLVLGRVLAVHIAFSNQPPLVDSLFVWVTIAAEPSG
jgi:hypothetical protein